MPRYNVLLQIVLNKKQWIIILYGPNTNKKCLQKRSSGGYINYCCITLSSISKDHNKNCGRSKISRKRSFILCLCQPTSLISISCLLFISFYSNNSYLVSADIVYLDLLIQIWLTHNFIQIYFWVVGKNGVTKYSHCS